MLRIHSIETFGTHEGPGIRLVVFLQGCHFRCLYCHNPDTWAMKGGKLITVQEIIALLEKELPYFQHKGGLTVSGGEPLIQREALVELFAEAKKRGIHTALDTNGYILDDLAKKLLDLTDLVLLDVKHIDSVIHRKLTGSTNEITLKFAKYCEEKNKKIWLRYVLVPTLTDQPTFLHQWGKRFMAYKSIERVEILPYHTLGVYKYKQLRIDYRLNGISPPTERNVRQSQDIFMKYFKAVTVR